MTKTIALAGLFACALASAAHAQEAAPTWTGPYVGLNAGYGLDDDRFVSNQGFTANNFVALNNEIRPSNLSLSREGVLAGLQAGYNMQMGDFLVGLEADWTLPDSESEATYRSPRTVQTFPAGRRTNVTHDLLWMSTLRARAGHTMGDKALVYLTGGYAMGRVKDTAVFNGDTDASVNYSGANKYNTSGWVAGGGVEYALGGAGWMGRTSLRLEYLHYDLGKKTLLAPQRSTPAGAYALRFDTKGDVMRAGVNFRF